MPTLNPASFDVHYHREPGPEPKCSAAAIVPDAMHDDASYVSILGLAALAITVAGAVFLG